MSEILAAAKRYRALGLHPIPIEPKGKRPLIQWKEYCSRQPTEQEIDAWWRANPNANVALVLGRGVFAVDIDGPEGEAALEAAGIEIPFTAPTATTGKGRHVFFSGQAPTCVGLFEKVDIRSDEGYVVAPPSIHPNGKRYTWITSLEELPPPAPPALVDALNRPTKPTPEAKPSGQVDQWLTTALAGVGKGERDRTCTKLAGYYIGKGIPTDVVKTMLYAWADRCDPPMARHGVESVDKCVDSIARAHGPVETDTEPSHSLAELVDLALVEINTPPAKRNIRPTGVSELDRLLSGGFEPGDLVYAGGRPGTGKTALGLQIARDTKSDVLIISREMKPVRIVRRLLIQVSGLRASDLKIGGVDSTQKQVIAWAASHLKTLPLHIRTAPTVEAIKQELASFDHGQIGLVVVDYLQRMRGPDELATNKRATVEYISTQLKSIAVDNDLAVLCISSLRRMPSIKGVKQKPEVDDLRESGELEFDADIVLLIDREFGSDVVDLVVGKNRDGAVGAMKLRFDAERLKFGEVL